MNKSQLFFDLHYLLGIWPERGEKGVLGGRVGAVVAWLGKSCYLLIDCIPVTVNVFH